MSLSIKKKAIKKAVSVVTTIATVVCMSGVASFSSLALADVVDGALIKSNATNSDGTPTLSSLDVYIVKLVGTKKFKRLVLNPTIFDSYGHLNWGDIQTVSQSVMDEYTTSALVRVDTDPDEKVYAMAPDGDVGSKSWVNVTSAEFLGVAGSEDGDSIYTINSTDAGSYVAVGDVTTVAALETFYSAGTLPDAEEVESGLNAALSSETPASTSVLKGSDGILYTKANFTAVDGDVTVTGMKVKRSGFGLYSDFDNVYLVVDGARRGSVKTINSADEASLLFSSDTQKVVVPDGETKVFEIWASIDATPQTASNALSITEVTTASDVSGLPVTGNAMTNSSADAPDYTLDEATIGNSANVGDTDVVVSKFKIDNDESNETAVFEAITFRSITLSGATRAYATDFTNFRLYDNSGNVVAGPIEMGSDNYLRFTLDTPFEVEAGTSKFEWFYVKADAVDGAGRTLNLSIDGTTDTGAYDVVVRGGTNMIRSDVTDAYDETNEWVTLGASDLSIATDSTNPIAADIVENSTVVLLSGNITAAKGAVNIEALSIGIDGTDLDMGDTDEFENLRVYVDDLLVSEATGVSLAATDDLDTWVDEAFTDTYTVDGVVPFRVEIDVKDLTDTVTTVIKATIVGTTITGTTVADGTAVEGTGTATGNNQTVVIPGYKIYRSASPISASKVLGSQDVEFLGFDVKANNTSNVTVNKIKFQWNVTHVAGETWAAGQNDVANLELFTATGEKVAGPVNLNSSKEYEFTGLGLDIDSNGSKYILKADIASSITNADNTDYGFFTIIASEGDANNNTYTAKNSAGTTIINYVSGGDTAVEINYDADVRTTLDSGTLTVTAANDMPTSAQLVVASTDNSLGVWKFVSANEDITIKKLRVGLTTGSAGEDEILRIGLYEGATKLAETYSFAGGYTEFDISSIVPAFVVEDGTGNARYLTVKVDLNSKTAGFDAAETIAAVLIDVEAWGATAEVEANSDGFVTSDIATLTYAADDADDVTIVVTENTHGVLDGDVLTVSTEQMYVVSGETTNTLTVVRAFNGTTTLGTITSANGTGSVVRSIEGNNFKGYNAKIVITDGGLASGTLGAWGSYTAVFKFKVTPTTDSVEEAILNGVKVSLAQSSGIGDTGSTEAPSVDWYVKNMTLYNGAGTAISTMETGVVDGVADSCVNDVADTALCKAADFVRFDKTTVYKNDAYSSSNVLSEPIASGGETYTIKAQIGGTVSTTDTLQLQIADLGTISAAAADVDWDDSVESNIIWVGDGVNEAVVGPKFEK